MMSSNTQNRKNASGNRSDIAWKYGTEVDNNPRKITCNYCNKTISGGVYRFKQHLACTRKDVEACKSVPIEVKMEMNGVLTQLKKSSKRRMRNEEEEGMVENVSHKRGKMVIESISNTTIGITQSMLNQISEKKLRDEACQQIIRFFRANGIPFSCAKNLEFAKMLELVGKCGLEFVPPSYHELENSSLKNEIKNTTDMLEEYKHEWKKTGCSIICEEWTDTKGRFYCNFLVNSPAGTIFLKSIDTSDFLETTGKVFEVLEEIVEKVGKENVVQVMTNNTANYKAAAEMLIEKRENIIWSPCVVQLLDETLEDFEKNLLHHHMTIAKGKKIITFIYSRTRIISMLRDFTKGKDLNGPTSTPSATAYLTLLYLIDMKDKLITMFSLKDWEELVEIEEVVEGKEIQQIVQDCGFWDDIVDCLNFALPIIEVLLKIDSNEKPTMGFIYKEMNCAKESLQSLNNAKGYETIWKIFNERWNAQPLLYAMSYFLNPQFHYDPTFEWPSEFYDDPFTCLARMVIDHNDDLCMTVENQFIDFSDARKLFGSQAAIIARHTKDPAMWWDSYGKHCPELQWMAIRLLSLTCSSCGSGQSWNAYEQVYPKKRSHLYQKKLKDLFLIIQNYKSKTQQARTQIFEGNNPEVLSLDNESITEKEVGEVSGAKKDMLVNVDVDEDVSEGVPLPENHSGNEMDTCLYNPQRQGSPSVGSRIYSEDCVLRNTTSGASEPGERQTFKVEEGSVNVFFWEMFLSETKEK